MNTARSAFTKADLFQLKAAIITTYMVQRALLNDIEQQYGNTFEDIPHREAMLIVNHTKKILKKLFVRARKMGIPNKTIYKLDAISHAVAYNWYS